MTTELERAALDELKGEVAGVKSFLETKVSPLKEELDRIAANLLSQEKRLRDIQRASLFTSSAEQRGVIQSGRYQGLDRIDLIILKGLAEAGLANRHGLDKTQLAHLEDWHKHVAAAMDSTVTGQGLELVPNLTSSQLWRDVNLATMVFQQFQNFTMPSEDWKIPLELGDIDFYPGVQNVAAKSTVLDTDDQTLSSKELVGHVAMPYHLEEDSVIAVLPEARQKIMRNTAEALDDVAINADTTELNNINADGATITSEDKGKAQWLIGFDGLRHHCLIDNTTGLSINHNAAVADAMVTTARKKMSKFGVNPADLFIVSDISTFLTSHTLTNLRTLDKFGPQATILTGQLAAMDGIPWLVSEKMLLTDTDGKVTDGAAGTVGSFLTVHRDAWKTGYKRQPLIEVERSTQKRQHVITISFRVALKPRTATVTGAALTYDITGV